MKNSYLKTQLKHLGETLNSGENQRFLCGRKQILPAQQMYISCHLCVFLMPELPVTFPGVS